MDMELCLDCHELVSTKAAICPFCGKRMADQRKGADRRRTSGKSYRGPERRRRNRRHFAF